MEEAIKQTTMVPPASSPDTSQASIQLHTTTDAVTSSWYSSDTANTAASAFSPKAETTTFYYFARLPMEIQLKIYNFHLSGIACRVLAIRSVWKRPVNSKFAALKDFYLETFPSAHSIPSPLLHVCSVSRVEALRTYPSSFSTQLTLRSLDDSDRGRQPSESEQQSQTSIFFSASGKDMLAFEGVNAFELFVNGKGNEGEREAKLSLGQRGSDGKGGHLKKVKSVKIRTWDEGQGWSRCRPYDDLWVDLARSFENLEEVVFVEKESMKARAEKDGEIWGAQECKARWEKLRDRAINSDGFVELEGRKAPSISFQ